jgi:hypothetical protein
MMRTKALFILFIVMLLGGFALPALADTALQSAVPAALSLPANNLVLNAYLDVDASAKRLSVNVAGSGGDLDLLVR